MTLSYYTKKGKVFMLVSTMHLSKGEEVGSKKKPEVIMHYNGTKSGVDTKDQMDSAYSTKQITHRWSMEMFYNMMDVSALNALIVYLFLNQDAFGRVKADAQVGWGKNWQVTKISNLAAPLLVSLVITKICHLGLHTRKDVTSIQLRKTEKRVLVCTMPQKCLYRTFCCHVLSVPKIVIQNFYVTLLCFPLDKLQEFFICESVKYQ